jgi:diguanylate cyclase (GGDEF)-like protein
MQVTRRSDSQSERQRLESIERMALLYTPAEECFDRVTRLAARLFAAPISMFTVVGERTVWLKSRHGTEVSEIAREGGFSSVTIGSAGPLVVADALADPRFARSELVVNRPYARFYAGIAVRSPDGARIGSLSVIDNEPRHLSDHEVGYLRDLGAVVESELHRRQLALTNGDMIRELGEARRRSMVDPLTSVWNRAGLDTILARELDAASMRGARVSVAMIDLDHFKSVNDRFGHAVGDTVLAEVARRLRVAARPIDSVARYGGEEFLVVLQCADSPQLGRLVAEGLRLRLRSHPWHEVVPGLRVSVSAGVANARPGEAPHALLSRADQNLYRAKRLGRDRVCADEPAAQAADDAIEALGTPRG